MRLLVVESDPGVAREVADEALRRGHDVLRCHEVAARAFPCAGMDGDCPLDGEGADVAVVVREAARIEPTAREDGARCALRRRVPVVVADAGAGRPYASHAAAVLSVDDPAEVVDAAERAVAAPAAGHADAVHRALAPVLGVLGVEPGEVEVAVERHRHQLVARLRGPARLSASAAGRLADVARSGLRGYDREIERIDVTWES